MEADRESMRNELRTAMGARLRALRELRGLTQDELAREIGIDKSGLSRIESGERGLDSVVMADLADVLDVSARDFFADGAIAYARSARSDAASDSVVADAALLIDEIIACEGMVEIA